MAKHHRMNTSIAAQPARKQPRGANRMPPAHKGKAAAPEIPAPHAPPAETVEALTEALGGNHAHAAPRLATPILDTLAHDHRALEQMLSELRQTSGSDPQARIELFSQLQTLLAAHSRAEEEVVYRRLRERLPDEEQTLESFEEHHVADLLMQELASGLPGGATWAAKAKVFEEVLRHHIKEEELQIFALVRENFDARTMATMDAEFRMLKHERIESVLGAVHRATPAFAGRAVITAQAAAGRYMRRGELYLRRRLGRMPE